MGNLELVMISYYFLRAAVAVNAKLQYSVVEVHPILESGDASTGKGKKYLGNVFISKQRNPSLVVATDLVPALEAKWGVKLTLKRTLLGLDLENCRLDIIMQFVFLKFPLGLHSEIYPIRVLFFSKLF